MKNLMRGVVSLRGSNVVAGPWLKAGAVQGEGPGACRTLVHPDRAQEYQQYMFMQERWLGRWRTTNVILPSAWW